MPITKQQVKTAIKKATVSDIKESEQSEWNNAIWLCSGDWEPETVQLNGTIKEQTDRLISVLERLHVQSEDELKKHKSYLSQGLSFGISLVNKVTGVNFTSWFKSMIEAMKIFGEYVTQTLETQGVQVTRSARNEVLELAEKILMMVANYVNHSVYRKLCPSMASFIIWKSLGMAVTGKDIRIESKDFDDEFLYTKKLIATLCRCVNYGLLKHARHPSWLSNIRDLIK